MTRRNDPCPCGSGRKYKKCHGLGAPEAAASPEVARARALKARDVALGETLLRFAHRLYGEHWLHDALDSVALLEDGDLPDGQLPLVVPWLEHFGRDGAGMTLAGRWRASRDGPRIPPNDRLLLDAYEVAWVSAWEVVEVEPGTGSRLRDVLTGEERFAYDVATSRSLRPFDTLLAIILDCDGVSFFGGLHAQPLPPREAADVVRAARRLCHVRTRPVPPERLRDPDLQLELLDLWQDAVEDLRHRPPPDFRNTDGDPLVPTTDDFALLAPRAEVAARLASIEGAGAPETDGEATVFVVTRAGNAVHASWPNTITGRLVLGATRLTAETNSARRADALRAAVEAACAGLVRHRLRREDSTAHLLAEVAAAPPRSRPQREAASSPEADAVLRRLRERHYRDWPDHPLPALDGLTPRAAAGQPRARPKLAALLKEFVQREAELPEGQRIDLDGLLAELGFGELREGG